MKRIISVAMLCVVCCAGCRAPQQETTSVSPSQRPEFQRYYLADNYEFFRTNLGAHVSVQGVAVPGKTGARLNSELGAVYIDGLSFWPKDVVWQIVIVTGTVIKRHDGPQLSKEQLDLPPEQQVQGTAPIGKAHPEGSKELHEARRRYLLRDVKYTVVKEEIGTPNNH